MIRHLVAIVFLAAAVGLVHADDQDPIKTKLLAAKMTYDNELEQYHKQAVDWFDKREATARKDGDKKLLDQVKAERKAFDEDDLLPKSAPPALKQKPAQARKAMDAAYAEAVKAYTKAKKDDEAASVEAAMGWTSPTFFRLGAYLPPLLASCVMAAFTLNVKLPFVVAAPRLCTETSSK